MRYFRIEDSFEVPNRWCLGNPKTVGETDVDPRLFTEGRKYIETHALQIPLESGINPLDFILGPFDMPVIKSTLGEIIQSLAPAEIQRIPVSVEAYNDYEILNVLVMREAIDENLSEIRRWTEEDDWPEKTGKYFAIGQLVLNGGKINDSKIFRLKNWELPLIVCENIKQKLEDLHTTGISFKELRVL